MTLLLDFRPERDSYQATPSYGVLETMLDGGASRKRKDVDSCAHYVNVTWVLTKPDDYNFFMYIFRQELENASLPFLCELITDSAFPILHKCKTMGGMPKLVRQKGHSYWVGATLEVEPVPTVMGLVADAGTLQITPFPFFGAQDWKGQFLPVDQVTIVGLRFTHSTLGVVDLDGTYDLGSVGTSFVTLDSPAGVNAAWTALAAATPDNGSSTTAIMYKVVT